MIYCLTGDLIFLDALGYTAVIDCAGVGYKVTVTAGTLTKLTQLTGKEVRVFTHMQVSENGVDLFGFYDADELEAFKLLINVSGVGPKAAIAILSIMSPTELSAAIATEDSKAISRAQGVGAKIAARVVLELKDKFAKLFPVPESGGVQPDPVPRSASKGSASKLSDARDALTVLGFSRAEAASALRNVSTDLPLEEMIKEALAALMK
ncbi:MAG: Holliday junction branch migration protein RuvA [Clostridia bacterium]|nr:Holliday junction branch migration protein RuvA [Clostridia bacterium]